MNLNEPTIGNPYGIELLAVALAESLEKPFPWAVGFLFGNTELSVELWTVIAGISGLDDS